MSDSNLGAKISVQKLQNFLQIKTNEQIQVDDDNEEHSHESNVNYWENEYPTHISLYKSGYVSICGGEEDEEICGWSSLEALKENMDKKM